MFFSKARKRKRVGDAVLAEVQPMMTLIERNTGKKISVLKDDNYFLGFITGMVALTMRRADQNLTIEDKGTILQLVIDQIYGDCVIVPKRLGDLLNAIPQKDEAFFKGFECAGKVNILFYGQHKLHDDPDYKEALAIVRSGVGHSLSLGDPGSSEDTQVATLLMNQYFDKLGRSTP